MAIRTLALTFVLVLCLSTQSYAQCVTPAEALARMPSPLSKDIQGDTVKSFVFAFNQIPPKTDVIADRVLVFYGPPYLPRLLFFNEGCLQTWADISPRSLLQLLGEDGV